MSIPSVGVVGATGAVGTVELELLAERGYQNVRAFASERSAGTRVPFGDGELEVELASAESLTELDLCLFSVGTSASAKLVPAAVENGAVCIDKSSAFRLMEGVPLVVPEVNASRADEHSGIVANPNCSTIQLVCVLEPLRRAPGLRSVRLATYQSASGAGDASMKRLLDTAPADLSVTMDWPVEGDEFEEEAKLRDETRKILELPDLPFMANCVRVPVLVGHCQAVWVETEEELSVEDARSLLSAAPSLRLAEATSAPREAIGGDEVLVGRIRRDPTVESGLVLFTACDNLRKGAALNALQIMERLAPAIAGSREGDLSARAPARTRS